MYSFLAIKGLQPPLQRCEFKIPSSVPIWPFVSFLLLLRKYIVMRHPLSKQDKPCVSPLFYCRIRKLRLYSNFWTLSDWKGKCNFWQWMYMACIGLLKVNYIKIVKVSLSIYFFCLQFKMKKYIPKCVGWFSFQQNEVKYVEWSDKWVAMSTESLLKGYLW
jgi:hypothetical protein